MKYINKRKYCWDILTNSIKVRKQDSAYIIDNDTFFLVKAMFLAKQYEPPYPFEQKNIKVGMSEKLYKEYLEFLSNKQDKEEESQNIMMEQVDKGGKEFECAFCDFKTNDYDAISLHNCIKDKPVEHKKCNYCQVGEPQKPVKAVSTSTDDNDNYVYVNGYLEKISPPIEDTNKTRLEVPNGIKLNKDRSYSYAADHTKIEDAINSIIDYLTLISLNKKV